MTLTIPEFSSLIGNRLGHVPLSQGIRFLEDGPFADYFVHLSQMLFTVGIVVSNPEDGHPVGRWCYPTYPDAQRAHAVWRGVGDPPGPWIKYKGTGGERKRWVPLGVTGWPVSSKESRQ